MRIVAEVRDCDGWRSPDPKENSDVESSAKTDKLPGPLFVLRTIVGQYVRSQENKTLLGKYEYAKLQLLLSTARGVFLASPRGELALTLV